MNKFVTMNKYALFSPCFVVFGTSQVLGQACCPLPGSESAGAEVTLIDYSEDRGFSVPTLNGEIFSLSDHVGKPVVLFTMAYRCATCISEAKVLSKLHDEYSDEIVIPALDVDPNSTVPGLGNFKEIAGSPGYTWGFDERGRVAQTYKIKTLETTIIFDQQGDVVYTDLRSTSYETF